MSSMAAYAIENGLDPFIKPDYSEWEGGLNPIYQEERTRRTPSHTSNNQQQTLFNTFKEASNLAKQNPGSKIVRSGERFAVYLK